MNCCGRFSKSSKFRGVSRVSPASVADYIRSVSMSVPSLANVAAINGVDPSSGLGKPLMSISNTPVGINLLVVGEDEMTKQVVTAEDIGRGLEVAGGKLNVAFDSATLELKDGKLSAKQVADIHLQSARMDGSNLVLVDTDGSEVSVAIPTQGVTRIEVEQLLGETAAEVESRRHQEPFTGEVDGDLRSVGSALNLVLTLGRRTATVELPFRAHAGEEVQGLGGQKLGYLLTTDKYVAGE